jgi:HEAT repeat protein
MTKASHGLKLSLIGLIEEMTDARGGRVLQTALLDETEEVAALAARAMGKVHFILGVKVLLKAVEIWETRLPESDVFLSAVCHSLGELAQPESISFLEDIASEKPRRRTKNFSVTARLEAIRALGKINLPETWLFLQGLAEEKNAALQETLQKLIRERRSA